MTKSKHSLVVNGNNKIDKVSGKLFQDIQELIVSAKEHVARSVNSSLVMLYWHIGNRIQKDILGQERAAYGEQIVAALGRQLTLTYGEGYSRASLFRMVQFAEVYPNHQIVAALTRQLSWAHFRELITVKDKLKRDFYAEMCRVEGWSYRTLEKKIGSMLYERTAIAHKPKKLAKIEIAKLKKEDFMSPDLAFRDPYFLDFLGLKDSAYDEKDLELAITREIEKFLIELGTDFSFVARQKRIVVDGDDFYIDLLFYHRRLRCLVAIELKLDKFRPQDKGQMELYLKWLEKYEMRPGENKPIGLVLCASKKHEQIELLELHKSGIRVSEFWTELPPKNILKKKLHEMVELGKAIYQNRLRLNKNS